MCRMQRLERLPLALQQRASLAQQEISEIVELPGGRDIRIQCTQGSGSRISRIRKTREPVPLALLIQTLERAPLHDYFATHFKARFGNRMAFQTQRQRSDGARVLCHVFSDASIASGDGLRKAFVIVVSRHR